jgi:uncharacterized protein YecT (DUF1311 family)
MKNAFPHRVMNRSYLTAASFVWLLIAVPAPGNAEEQPEVICTSPGGTYRVELARVQPPKAEAEAQEDVWIVSTRDPAARAKLPKQSPDSPADDEFHFSPDEKWMFGLRHIGSGLRYANIYHLVAPSRIEVVGKQGFFNDIVWENCVKLGALKRDYSAEGVYAMTFFVGWSFDSSRLLIKLCGGEEKRDMRSGLLYYNTRTKKFEQTDYLRKLNKAGTAALPCAEPVDPPPGEGALKTRLDALDQQLNAKYATILAQAGDRAPVIREAERSWIRHRDDGAKFYVLLFPPAEKARRRLQFLCDVTAERIDVADERWEIDQ